MKKILFGFMVLFLAVALIGACPVPGCQYINDCTTWHLSAAADPSSGTIHLTGTVVVGDAATAAKSGRLMVVLDGGFGCTTCGVDDTTYTGQLIDDVTVPQGTTQIDLTFVADTTVPHNITLYLGQSGCANCAKTTTIHVDWYYAPPKPIWLMMWMCTDESSCFNIGVVPGPDGACFVYDLTGDIIPTSTAASLCSVAPNANMELVYAGWVTLPRPGNHQVWGPNGEGDKLLAKINKDHGWHLAYAWFFPGYGGH